MYPPSKKRTRENGTKMWPVRTGTLQRCRQIISLGKPAAQCYGGNVSADPLCSEALLRTISHLEKFRWHIFGLFPIVARLGPIWFSLVPTIKDVSWNTRMQQQWTSSDGNDMTRKVGCSCIPQSNRKISTTLQLMLKFKWWLWPYIEGEFCRCGSDFWNAPRLFILVRTPASLKIFMFPSLTKMVLPGFLGKYCSFLSS